MTYNVSSGTLSLYTTTTTTRHINNWNCQTFVDSINSQLYSSVNMADKQNKNEKATIKRFQAELSETSDST